MEKAQRRGADGGENTERDCHPRRQRRRRNQHRPEEQKRERVFEAAGQIQQAGEFGDVQRQQCGGVTRRQALHRIDGDLQRQGDESGGRDDGDAGDDRNVEIETLHDEENRGELAEGGQPAQPQDGIKTDIALRMAQIRE
jgi:hypothetical protein